MVPQARALAFAFVTAAVSVTHALAQQPVGTVAGTVTDPQGRPLAGATVVVTDPTSGTRRELTTGAEGRYAAVALLPGTYEVRVAGQGFKTAAIRLWVRTGETTQRDVSLVLGDFHEVVEVDAPSSGVDPGRTALEGVVTQDLIRELPLNGRNFLDLGQLEPGTQLSAESGYTPGRGAFSMLSFSGDVGGGTRITVDGIDITDEIVASAAMNLSQESIEEFQISRSTFDSSTGLTGAGGVNIVTRSGSNAWHGSALFALRTDRWAARLGTEPAPFDREQYGASLGGPLVRDRLFGFLSLERTNQDASVATQIAGFPQFSRSWAVPYDETMWNARLDWNVGQGRRAFARYSRNTNEGEATGRLGLGGSQVTPFLSTVRGGQAVLGLDLAGAHFTHSFRAGYLDTNWLVGPSRLTDLPRVEGSDGRAVLVSFAPFGAFDAVNNPPLIGPSVMPTTHLLQRNHELRYDGAATLAGHLLRWGGLVNLVRVNWFASFFGDAPEVDVAVNADTEAVCGSDLSCYPVTSHVLGNGRGYVSETPTLGKPFGGGKNDRVHAYVADDWRIGSRVTLALGLRWLYEPGQTNSDLAKPPLLAEFDPTLARPDREVFRNFAPRLGITWDPRGDGKWVLRAAGGVYYDVNAFNSTLYFRQPFLPYGIGWEARFVPASPSCADPRFPDGRCPLAAPGLIDDVLGQWDAYRADAAEAEANYPDTPTIFELTRGVANGADPDYQTPRSLLVNVGFQRQLGPGLVLSVDYVRSRGSHYPVYRDRNRVGAANTLSEANARGAMDALQSSLGCPAGPEGVACSIRAGATIEDYAAYGLGSGEGASAEALSVFAFPGRDPRFNKMVFAGWDGRSSYDGLQVALRGRLPDIGRVVRDWTVTGSYALSRYEAETDDRVFGNVGGDTTSNDDPARLAGPAGSDRLHNLNVAMTFQVPGGVRLSSIWRAMSPLPQSLRVPVAMGSSAEIFYTDFEGDGTVGDLLADTRRGSYGRDAGCGAGALNGRIDAFNAQYAGTLTPAGRSLVAAGLFTEAQLQALGAVIPPVPRAPAGQVCLDWFLTTDLRVSRPFKVAGGRVTIEPALEVFNLFNTSNYDLPGFRMLPYLSGAAGTVNGTTPDNRSNRAGYTGGPFALGTPRSWQLLARVSF